MNAYGGGRLGGGFVRQNFFLKEPNTPGYAQVSVVLCPNPNSVTALLSPPPPTCRSLQYEVSRRSKQCGWLLHSAFVQSWSLVE